MTSAPSRVMIAGNQYFLTEKLGEGLEADIYRVKLGNKWVAVKIFRSPSHPSFQHDAGMRSAAQDRHDQHQRKLRAFPTDLPKQIITPDVLIEDYRGEVIGFTMEILPDGYTSANLLTDVKIRREKCVTNADILPLLIELGEAIRETHGTGVIFGDALSGNNVQFGVGKGARVIDANCLVLPGFPNNTHTRLYVDPLLCNQDLLLIKPHSENGDWYTYAVLVTTALTLLHPYFDGIYTPDDEMSEEERVERRISIFHQDVELPDTAIDPALMPDELATHLRKIFEEDLRGPGLLDLLKTLAWTVCTCGVQHGRISCPKCGVAPKGTGATRQGSAEITTLFTPPIGSTGLEWTYQDGALRHAYADGSDIHRDTNTVLTGAFTSPEARILICCDRTAVVDGQALTLYNTDGSTAFTADNVAPGNGKTASNSHHVYWVTPSNDVMRDEGDSTRRVGRIAGPATQIWVGEEFGVAFWREIMASVTVFDRERAGLRSVMLPAVPGDLIDVHCTISSSVAWLLLTLERGGQRFNHCYAIDREGNILASTEVEAGTEPWLDAPVGLHTATGNSLYTPTVDGLVRVDIKRNGSEHEFVVRDPHTSSAPFVRDATRIAIGQGMIVQTDTTINRIVNR